MKWPTLCASLLLCAACGDDSVPAPLPAGPCARAPDEIETPPPHTPRWAFEPWISKDISTTEDTYAFVDGFRERAIPVGVVVLDSPWETNYNTFVPNPDRYPAFDTLVSDMHERGVRVVLWITQMVNNDSYDFEAGGDVYPDASPNLAEALECGYLVNEGEQFGWWKGVGGAVDFDNPSGTAWWHRQQDPLFDAGVSGFKLDFGDSYVRKETLRTYAGEVVHQHYSERYYEDFFAYGVSRRGPEDFLTMVRAWDESYDFEGRFYARREHAPVAWMGDNRRDWVGLADALDHMFVSAEAGYPVLGSDIGGYLDRDDVDIGQQVPFDSVVFARWTAIGALSPFMQLHGRANLTPWTVEDHADETIALYRYWASLHHELSPFFYSLAQKAWAEGGSIVHPIGAAADWPGDYRYLLGEALLVAPVLEASGVRDVPLPEGARWYDWWDEMADPIEGGTVIAGYDASARERLPLFVREGALVPLQVDSDVTGLGSSASADAWTVLVYPGPERTSFDLIELDDSPTHIATQTFVDRYEVELDRATRNILLRVRADVPVTAVSLGGNALAQKDSRTELDAAEEGWWPDAAGRVVWLKLAPRERSAVVVLDKG